MFLAVTVGKTCRSHQSPEPFEVQPVSEEAGVMLRRPGQLWPWGRGHFSGPEGEGPVSGRVLWG